MRTKFRRPSSSYCGFIHAHWINYWILRYVRKVIIFDTRFTPNYYQCLNNKIGFKFQLKYFDAKMRIST